MEELGGKIEEPRGAMYSRRRPTEAINMDLWGLPESEPPTKEHTGAETRPLMHVPHM